MIKNIFSRNKIEILPIKAMGNKIVFQVKNGMRRLKKVYGNIGEKEIHMLMFDDIPLINFHGENYFCPTCEKMISAGYGLDKCSEIKPFMEKIRQTLNISFDCMEKSFEALKPFFGLLESGYYLLSEEELFPTNGDEEFFWKIGSEPKLNQATYMKYDSEDFRLGTAKAKYMLPTQPPERFNRQCAEEYRTRKDTRALAYSTEGNLCAVLDGHHKATAAAIDGKSMKTLLISPMTAVAQTMEGKGKWKRTLYFNEFKLPEEELPIKLPEDNKIFPSNRLKEDELKRLMLLKEKSFDKYEWPQEILDTAKQYYSSEVLAYIEWAGDLSDGRLNGILEGKCVENESTLIYIAEALYATKNPRFTEFTISVCKNEIYRPKIKELYELLAKVKTQEVEDFFVEYLVDIENNRQDIKKIIDDYFAEYELYN